MSGRILSPSYSVTIACVIVELMVRPFGPVSESLWDLFSACTSGGHHMHYLGNPTWRDKSLLCKIKLCSCIFLWGHDNTWYGPTIMIIKVVPLALDARKFNVQVVTKFLWAFSTGGHLPTVSLHMSLHAPLLLRACNVEMTSFKSLHMNLPIVGSVHLWCDWDHIP